MAEPPGPKAANRAVAHAARLAHAFAPFGRAIAAGVQSAARSSGVTDLGKPTPAETRIGQVLAAFSLMFVVPVLMVFIMAAHELAVDVLGDMGLLDIPGIPIVLLFVGLGLFLVMVWLCFKWVSSQAFGLFSFGTTKRGSS